MNMKKGNVFTVVAAASMILSQAGQLSVFAQETNGSMEAQQEANKQELSKKELLELAIQKAQKLETEAKKGLEDVTPAYNESKAQFDRYNAPYPRGFDKS